MAKLSQKQRENRERSNANLVKFQAGQSGNPGGRPKGSSLTALLRRRLEEASPKKPAKNYGERSVDALILRCIRGDVRALVLLFDRVEGKNPESGGGGDILEMLRGLVAAQKGKTADEPGAGPAGGSA